MRSIQDENVIQTVASFCRPDKKVRDGRDSFFPQSAIRNPKSSAPHDEMEAGFVFVAFWGAMNGASRHPQREHADKDKGESKH